ncbi:MAG: response regulator [Planctomycetaceae bacterium]|nr:response regulator [Planctomycetaceae bacterium]
MVIPPEGPKLPASLLDEVKERFGLIPNFFCLASESPEITQNLWGFAKTGYIDNPLPSLFKERLFVYMSRFCSVRYCIARHVGFLIGLGHPAGDSNCRTETVDQAVRLIRRDLPEGDDIRPQIAALKNSPAPLPQLPESDSPTEFAIIACATHVFLQTPQAPPCLDALRRVFRADQIEHLLVFLTFVRTAHFWTRIHPELTFEDDLQELFSVHEELAECVLSDPDAEPSDSTQGLLDELAVLRREQALWEEVQRVNLVLEEKDRQKDEFLATLAHELRNPLAPIRTGLELMKVMQHDTTALEEIRSTLEQQTKHLTRLVDDLLDVSRITSGKLQLKMCPVELEEVLRSSVTASQPFIDEGRHELLVTIPDQPVYLNADPQRLAQVFSNLLNNAAKYTPEGGRLLLTAVSDGSRIVVSVEDNGIGIPAERQTEIFSMFLQIESSPEELQQGLGVGLTLVKTLVEMHEGTVSVHSDGEHQGSVFRVSLPAIPNPQFALSGPVPPRGGLVQASKRRVLVVDDNRAAASMLSMVVKLLGHEVQTAHDGLEATELAADFLPDVILMDVGMPRMDGNEAARHIRAQPWGEPMMLVALTGWGQDEDRQRTREAGFDHHLVKPAEPSAIEELLARSSSRLN